MKYRDVVSVVLGGGRGSRLYPLTKSRAKPAVPLAGKYRLIDIPISNCINSGMQRIYVLTQFLTASLHGHVTQTYKFDQFSRGFVELLPAEQTRTNQNWYQGTADAVRRQLERLLYHPSRDMVILAGDHIYRMDYGKFVDYHREKAADVTVAVLPLAEKDAHRFGILKTDTDGRIQTFREKPKTEAALQGLQRRPGSQKPYMASMGIYVFRSEVVERLLEGGQEEDFGHHIIPKAIENSRVYAYPFEGYWEDIGTIDCFYRANLALANPEPEFSFYEVGRPVYTHARFLPPSVVDRSEVEETLMAEGCRVTGARLEHCTVGLRSIISEGAQLRGVVMMGADYYEDEAALSENRRQNRPNLGVGENVTIEQAIIDKNVRIGNGVRIFSGEGQPDTDEDNYCIRDGIVVIPKNATITEGTVIGVPRGVKPWETPKKASRIALDTGTDC